GVGRGGSARRIAGGGAVSLNRATGAQWGGRPRGAHRQPIARTPSPPPVSAVPPLGLSGVSRCRERGSDDPCGEKGGLDTAATRSSLEHIGKLQDSAGPPRARRAHSLRGEGVALWSRQLRRSPPRLASTMKPSRPL